MTITADTAVVAPPAGAESAIATHTGALMIVPPPPYPLVDKSRFRPTLDDPDVHVVYYIRTTAVETKHGPTRHRHATALRPRSSDPVAAPDMLAQLTEIGTAFPTRRFDGHIEARAADGRRWRYVIGEGGVARIVYPEVVYRWPGELGVEEIKLSGLAQEALAVFAARPGAQMTTTEVAAALKRPVSTLSGTLNTLQERGLLRGAYEQPATPVSGVRRHPYVITAKGLAWKPQ